MFNATPRPLYSPERELYRRPGVPCGRSGRVRTILLSPGICFLFRLCAFSLLRFLDCRTFCLLSFTLQQTQNKHPCPRRDFLNVFLCTFIRISLSSLSWLLPFVPTMCNTQHKHTCPRRDSNPQSQQAVGRRSSPYTVRPLGSAGFDPQTVQPVASPGTRSENRTDK